jgi:hypothetical protein
MLSLRLMSFQMIEQYLGAHPGDTILPASRVPADRGTVNDPIAAAQNAFLLRNITNSDPAR